MTLWKTRNGVAGQASMDVLVDHRLPALAWLAHAAPDGRARAVVGPAVSHAASAFWEGLHPGHIDIADAVTMLATGADWSDGTLRVHTPTHTLDRVFFVRNAAGWWVSNSIALALKHAQARLKPDYLFYPWEFETIDRHWRAIPIEGGELFVLYNAIATLAPGGEFAVSHFKAPQHLKSFEQYKALLVGEIGGALALSGQMGNRSYRPILTLSRGYDSTCAAALASEFGVHEALSIRDSRQGGAGAEDASETARALGLTLHTIGRRDYQRSGLNAERLFYSTALAEEICFYPLADRMAGRIVLLGHHGDTMWDMEAKPVGTFRRDNVGPSLQAMRVRAGWVNFPIAFIGWQRHADIIAITRSEAMRAWSVGGDYDRPIPRRIAEEAGVPRHAFGMEKSAVTVSAGLAADDDVVSEEFATLLQQHWRSIDGLKLRAMALGVSTLAALNKTGVAAYKQGRASRVGPRATNGVLAALRTSPLRRKLLRPIQPLTFAAQVATERLVGELPDLTALLTTDAPKPQRALTA